MIQKDTITRAHNEISIRDLEALYGKQMARRLTKLFHEQAHALIILFSERKTH